MTKSKVTTEVLRQMKQRREKITALTAYDFPFAHILDQAGIEVILVGDSAANVVYGYTTTLPIGMPEMLYHTRAVAAAVKQAMIVADMPFLSYQVSIQEAVANAGALMKAGAEAVKLEGGQPIVKTAERLVQLGIPVMGHLGLTPQSVHKFGGHKLQARTATEQDRLLDDARKLEAAGCFSLVLEKIPRELGKRVAASLNIPVIGIGAGPDCDGQILVLHDILGLFERKFRFAKRYAELGQVIRAAVDRYRNEVKAVQFPDAEHSYSAEDSNSKGEITS
jgi:3-methyl-2-oxobutanoate hydroxymethyltransferase